jgi:hypothetical protein
MRFMAVRMLLLLVTTFVWLIQARSWLSCPPSPNSFFSNRAGSFTGPCEFDILPNQPVTQVRSGDFLKVGWPSVNQGTLRTHKFCYIYYYETGGGFVRLALASSQYRYNSSAFNNNILKVACFGCSPDAQDTNASLSAISRCNHPCGAGGPCDGGSVQTLPESYQTAIQIPTNLPDGSYLLQW